MAHIHTIIVIGLGHQALKEHIPSILRNRTLRLIGVVDCQQSVLDQAKKKYGVSGFLTVKELLAHMKPDIAVVCVPHCEYEAILKALFAAHVSVFKEKPFACSYTEAMRLHAMIRASKSTVMIHVQRRCNLYYQAVKKLLANIGKPFFVEGQYFIHVADPHSGWRGQRRNAGGGCIIDMGYHLIDLVLLYLGLPDHIHATFGSYARQDAIYDAEDTASILLQYDKKNIFGTLNISRFIGPKQEYLRIVGTKGYIVVKAAETILYANDGTVRRTIFASRYTTTDVLKYFVRVIEKKSPNISDSAIHLEHTAMIQACYQSGVAKKFISPKQIMKEGKT